MRRVLPSPNGSGIPTVRVAITQFVALFLLTTVVLVAVWAFLAPGYAAAVAGLTRPLLAGVESPRMTVLELRGGELWVYRIVGPGQIAPFTWFDRYAFFGVIPLLALLIATPGIGWRRRVLRAGIGVAVLLGVHVAYLVVSIELSYATLGLIDVGPFVKRTLDLWQTTVRVVYEAAPVAIWAVLSAAAWRRILRADHLERRRERCRGSEAIRTHG